MLFENRNHSVLCITVRDTTERPITLTQGTNRLVHPDAIATSVQEALSGNWPGGTRPDLWDGKTAERVAQSLWDHMSREATFRSRAI